VPWERSSAVKVSDDSIKQLMGVAEVILKSQRTSSDLEIRPDKNGREILNDDRFLWAYVKFRSEQNQKVSER
jgi:hypothetical protein